MCGLVVHVVHVQPAEYSRHLLTLEKYNHMVRAKAKIYEILLSYSNVDLVLLEKTRYGMVWKSWIKTKLKRKGQAKHEIRRDRGNGASEGY